MFGGNGNGIVPVMPFGNMNGNNNGGWGNDWWAWIILLVLFGWNGNGNGLFGNGGNQDMTAMDASLQRGFNNQAVISKLDGITNGICNLGYDQLSQMNGINTGILTQGNALSAQIQSCCCAIENAIMQAQFANQVASTALGTQIQQESFNRAKDTCDIIAAINASGQAAMLNCNNNYRALHDEIVDIQRQADKQTIADLRAQLERCDDQNMINAQTQYLTNYLRPQPNPAFVVPAPWFAGGYGYNNGNCCCGNNAGFGFGF